jgi:hypothetical protein
VSEPDLSGVAFTISDRGETKIPELIKCFLRAVERFRAEEALRGSSEAQLPAPDRAAGALTEALNWAHSMDDYLGARGPEGTLGTQRDADWAKEFTAHEQNLVRGFRYARNRLQHEWWQAVAVRLDLSGESPPDWLWAELTPAKREDARGEAAYNAAIRGRPVMETLDELAAIFFAKRRWVIFREDIEQPGHVAGSPLTFDDEQQKPLPSHE